MSNWISVEKQPPENWDLVLLYRRENGKRRMGTGYKVERDDGANVWHFINTTRHWPEGTFTHWQPLPAAPEGVDHD